MQVLALGLPRCGTTSLTAALESDILNIKPTLHAFETVTNLSKFQLILDAFRLQGDENKARRQALLHQVTDGYAACMESMNVVAGDLMDLYPEAKLVLNVRPPPKNGEPAGVAWARSCDGSVRFFSTWWGVLACWPLQRYRFWWYRYRLQTNIWRSKGVLAQAETPGWLESKGSAWMTVEFYENYLAWVQEEARKRGRDILIWHLGMGWGPLCDFLDREAPPKSVPVPYLNELATTKKRVRNYVRQGLQYWALYSIILGGAWWLATI